MPTLPDGIVNGDAPDFDDFYLASRRRLVLSAYALTGDLGAARHGVEAAYVAARHHWRKVRRLPDPEEWVRPRAWATAQRRHVARLWHREKGIDAEQLGVLDALHHLPDQQRKVLLLAHTAALSTSDIGRELGETTARVEASLSTATASFCRESGTAADEVGAAIESLAPIAEAAALPAPSVVDRGGRRRAAVFLVAGTAMILVLTLVGGLFVVRGNVEEPAAARAATDDARPVTGAQLLSLPQVRRLAPREPWRLVGTSDNTAGSGINSMCQATRFADPHGAGTLVRTFATTSAPTKPPHDGRDGGDLPLDEGFGHRLPHHARLVRRL